MAAAENVVMTVLRIIHAKNWPFANRAGTACVSRQMPSEIDRSRSVRVNWAGVKELNLSHHTMGI